MDIKTFVFLDTETTGLPSLDNNNTKVTEICLSAIRSKHIEKEELPILQNKINLCINPTKLVDNVVTAITGLSNDLLKDEPVFNTEVFSIIQDFLNLHQKPICFVAHNGDRFDYPILRAEIHNSGNELSGDILCVDSIKAFISLKIKTKTTRYTLTDVYEAITNKKPQNKHRAEGDVDLLIECVTIIGKKFVEWSNINATHFSNIPMMTPGVELN